MGQVNGHQHNVTHNIRCLRLLICADFTGPVSRGFFWWDPNTTWYTELSAPPIEKQQSYRREW